MSTSKVNIEKDIVSSPEGLAKVATALTDWQIKKLYIAIYSIQKRYMFRANTPENLEELRDEILTKCAEMNILATVDPAPVFYGEPPILEILGEINVTNDGAFDHERKGWEVNKANELGEDFRGQKTDYKG